MTAKTIIYRVFGLTIASEFCLPGLTSGSGEPDVIVTQATVPERLEDDDAYCAVRFQINRNAFLLNVTGVARFLVLHGNKIIVDPAAGGDKADIAVFLLGSVFGALLKQRGHLVLHGSAIAVNGHSVILSGVSGAGKSTLAAAFYKKGYEILTDDLCVIAFSHEGVPAVLPGYPRLKLWADAAENLGEDIQALSRVRTKLDKYELPLNSSLPPRALPLRSLYCLIPKRSGSVNKQQLTGLEKMKTLLANTYRYRFVEGMGQKPLHFQQCGHVAKAIEIYEITRPYERFCVDEVMACVEADCLRSKS